MHSTEQVARQYDRISKRYDDWFPDNWPAPVKSEGTALHSLIRDLGHVGTCNVLDLTCGIGTQAIGLALHGHKITAMDISAGQLGRAEKEERNIAHPADTPITWIKGDAGRAGAYVAGPFDVVISFANSLPLLGSRDKVTSAIQNAHALLKAGGHIIVSMRDHTLLRKDTPYLIDSGRFQNGQNEGVWLETGEWVDDGYRYHSHIIFVYTKPEYKTYHYPFPPLDAITKQETLGLLTECGFTDAEMIDRESGAFPCPVYSARKAS